MDAMMSLGASNGWRKGPWTKDEDEKLIQHINLHGEGRWTSVSKISGLNRNGKSCRLRWINYLRPGLRKGNITPQEEGIIIQLHSLWGNKWSTIARYLPGRTDNEIKNYWRTHFKKDRKLSNKQVKRRRSTLQLQKQQDELVTNSKTVMVAVAMGAVENKLINISISPSKSKVIDNQNSYEQERETLERDGGRKYDIFKYPSMDFQYYSPPTMLSQNVESSWSENVSSIAMDDLWGGLWNLRDDHSS